MFKEIHLSKRIEMSFHWQAVSVSSMQGTSPPAPRANLKSFDLQSYQEVEKDMQTT